MLVAVGYLATLVVAVGLFFLIREHGEMLTAPATASESRGLAQRGDVLVHVLLTLAAVIVLGQVLGRLASFVGQPRPRSMPAPFARTSRRTSLKSRA